MNEFVVTVLTGTVSNLFSAPVIALLALRKAFRVAVASVLIDARELRSIHHKYGQSGGLPWVASEMADRLAAQLEAATRNLRGHLGLVAYLGKKRDLARTCATAAWGIMLSQREQAEKAEIVVDSIELLNTALGSWRVDASRRALHQFPAIARTWLPDEGDGSASAK
ncbi:MAG: hypothetical protein ACRDPA_16060 [Solirubrobacteraceae bacterium]